MRWPPRRDRLARVKLLLLLLLARLQLPPLGVDCLVHRLRHPLLGEGCSVHPRRHPPEGGCSEPRRHLRRLPEAVCSEPPLPQPVLPRPLVPPPLRPSGPLPLRLPAP